MCATGALLANPYGMPALLVKLFGVFFYGFWILLHQLDIRSEHYPLVRIKYLALLLLLVPRAEPLAVKFAPTGDSRALEAWIAEGRLPQWGQSTAQLGGR